MKHGRYSWLGVFWLVLLYAAPAGAWNASGHRVVALRAFQLLEEDQRAYWRDILAAHPEAGRFQRKARPVPGLDGAGFFVEASTWADEIRHDPRFQEEGPSGEGASGLDGYADLGRHRDWHFREEADDYGPGRGVLDQVIPRLQRHVHDETRSRAERAVALAWLMHLVADAHQPLHVARLGPDDHGGLSIRVLDLRARQRAEMDLHSWWDQLGGPMGLRGSPLLEQVNRLPRLKRFSAPGAVSAWLAEGRRLAATEVRLPEGDSPEGGLFVIDDGYRQQAQGVANQQLARAGERLAMMLKGGGTRQTR